MSDVLREIEQAKADVLACECALDHAEPAFVASAVLRLSAARERLNVLIAEAKRERVAV